MLTFSRQIEEIIAHLHVATIQSIPTDDQIIMQHVRSALAISMVIGDEIRAAAGENRHDR